MGVNLAFAAGLVYLAVLANKAFGADEDCGVVQYICIICISFGHTPYDVNVICLCLFNQQLCAGAFGYQFCVFQLVCTGFIADCFQSGQITLQRLFGENNQLCAFCSSGFDEGNVLLEIFFFVEHSGEAGGCHFSHGKHPFKICSVISLTLCN